MGKIYWEGNSAKSIVISHILSQTRTRSQESFLIFDYGCGDGGDWHNILADNPNIKLICFDPDKKSIMKAKKKLNKYNVTFLEQAELLANKFKAHFITSFSVLEHVYNKKKYLSIAKEHLCKDGIFFLNYDDGHFRNFLDLTQPSKWFRSIKEWIHNLLAYPLALVGFESKFQKRIESDYINNLIEEQGFKIIDSFYSNLSSFKGLFKSIPEENKEEFIHFWIEVEHKLNNKFLYLNKANKYWGDYSNLWQFMSSRTLILKLK